MGEPWTIEGFRDGLEKLGESEVRRRLAGSVYGPKRSEKYELVEQWLFDKATERENTREAAANAFAREANDLAHEANTFASKANALASDANTIAERAASSARTANRIALAAALIAAAAVIISAWQYLPWSAPPSSPVVSSSAP